MKAPSPTYPWSQHVPPPPPPSPPPQARTAWEALLYCYCQPASQAEARRALEAGLRCRLAAQHFGASDPGSKRVLDGQGGERNFIMMRHSGTGAAGRVGGVGAAGRVGGGLGLVGKCFHGDFFMMVCASLAETVWVCVPLAECVCVSGGGGAHC